MATKDAQSRFEAAQAAREANEEEILVLPNVVGVGVGHKVTKGEETDEICLVAYVEKRVEESELKKKDVVPKTVRSPGAPARERVKTDVVEVGKIEAQPFTQRIRPAKPGYSIGHPLVTAGTFGCLVRERCGRCRVLILSNNHVLANSNASSIGDPIYQPGRADGGLPAANRIGRLARFVPIRFNNPQKYNLVDAAVARPNSLRNVVAAITGLGIPRGTVEATLGMDVVKSGRTTEVTTGRVIGVDATVAVGFGPMGVAFFRNQIVTTNMSAGGDSGSLLLSREGRLGTGLLFAGSPAVTLHNNLNNVLMALGVELITA